MNLYAIAIFNAKGYLLSIIFHLPCKEKNINIFHIVVLVSFLFTFLYFITDFVKM